jgi:hypothetical protein
MGQSLPEQMAATVAAALARTNPYALQGTRAESRIFMAKFMLLLFDNPADYADLTPAQMQQVVKEYGEWAGSMGKKGTLVGGEKLADEGGKVLKKKGAGAAVTDGPFAESKEVLGGYFLIEAPSYDAAVEVAKSCPHMKYGACTHIRQIDHA